MKQIYNEQHIVTITFPESLHEDIRCANIEKALNPSNFPSVHEMETVFGYFSQLTFFQRGLLTDALIHCLRESHKAQVSFSLQECDYALGAPGIEIRNDTVTEEERLEPIKVIFAVNRELQRMLR